MRKLIILKLILLLAIPIFSQTTWQVTENFDGPELNSYMWWWHIPWYENEGAAIIRPQNITFEYDYDINSNVVVLNYKQEVPPINGYNYSVGQLYSVPNIWHGEVEMRAKLPNWG